MDIDEGDDDASLIVSSAEIHKAEEEAQTWDLLRRILPLRYRDTSQPQNKPSIDTPNRSRKQWWDDFILSESLARERKVVLEWLQSSASLGPPIEEVVSELQQNAERGDILAHGWLHTRHKIKLQKSVNAYQGVLDPADPNLAESHLSSNTLITQLDPDAMTRQGRKLESQDESFERAIWLGCFEMLRRGQSMSDIREWCSERTESWRAATISKLPLSNSEDQDSDDMEPESVILWRRMCFATARQGGVSDFERAVYGLLSGDLSSVDKVCKTWDDLLFAHYNALVRTQFDSFLIKHGGPDAVSTAQSLPAFNAVQHHGDPVTVGKRLIAMLETDERTKREAMTVAKALQGAIVSNDLDKHLYQQGLVLAHFANQKQKSKMIPDYGIPAPEHTGKFFGLSDHDGLRVLAHVFIVITTLDRLSGASKDDGSLGALHLRHRVQEHIVATYISYLRLANLEIMVPMYCSKLLGPRIYETLSRNLIQIVNQDARVHQLSIMRKLGLDVAEFARTQPRLFLEDANDTQALCEARGNFKVLQDGPPTLKYGRIVKADFFGEDADFVDRDDEYIIRAMEWLMLVPGLFMETCTFATRAYKYFLSQSSLFNLSYSLADMKI
jgi:nuclear pore complex protein Nup107